MASIRKQGNTFEIRECRSTGRGPRQFTLARFRDVLTPEALEEAAARAKRPFDAQGLAERAAARGIPVSRRRTHGAARQLLAELRGGRPLDPSLVSLLKQALAHQAERPLPEHLADAAEWLGRSEAARGKALRGLLRTASRILRSRGALPGLPDEPFPRFRSGEPVS